MRIRIAALPILDKRFLAKNWGTLAIWPLVCLFFGTVLWYATFYRIEKEKEFLNKNALAESAVLANGYATHVSQLVRQIDQVLLETAFYWQHTKGTIRLEEIAATGVYSSQLFQKVAIVDGRGMVITSTASQDHPGNPRKAIDSRNQAYFAAHRTDPSTALRIGVVVDGIIFGKRVIQFTRRLNGPDGQFQGAVLLAVEPDVLTSYYKLANLRKEGLIALVGNDGALRASRVGSMPSHPGDAFETSPMFQKLIGNGTLFEGNWFRDGLPRFTSAVALDDFPLIAVAGVSRNEYVANFASSWAIYRWFAYASSLMLLCFAIVATFLAGRLALKQHVERIDNEAYRLATESSVECFYLLRALFDKDGEIIDFQLVDCNERGAALFGLSRDTFLGAKVSSFYKDDYLDRMMSVYLHAMKQGFYEDEYRVPSNSPVIRSQWLHRKFVRSGISLAMTVRDITESKAYQHSLLRMANEDALTSLPNRHWLVGYLPQAIKQACAHGGMLGLFFIDLDGFKGINDRYGHQTGDAVLCEVARRMQSTLRQDDKAVRLGGDEFMIIVEQVVSRELLEQVAARLCSVLNQPLTLDVGTLSMGASIGISIFPEHGDTLDTLLNHADAAMYSVKRAGKGTFGFYSPDNDNLFG